MGLRDWEFELLKEHADDGKTAQIFPTYGRRHALICVCLCFRDHSPEEQRNTIAHELVHCHLEPACDMIRRDLDDALGKKASRVVWGAYVRQIEYAVDGHAGAVAPALPLIDWPEAT